MRVLSLIIAVLISALGLGADPCVSGPAPPSLRLVPVRTIQVGEGDLKSVRISPDGRLAYIENLEGRATLIYDARSYRRVRTLRHVGKPVETAFTDGGRYVWISYLRLLLPGYPTDVPDETRYDRPSCVAVYDSLRARIVRRIAVGVMPKFMAVSPDGGIVAVSNWISDTVTLVDARRFEVVATIPVGHVPRGLCFTPDGRWLYVANFRGSSLSVVDMQRQRVVKTLERVGDQPRHIVISPDGGTLFLSTNRDGQLHKYALTSRDAGIDEQRTASVFVGKEARTIGLTPDGRFVLVCCFESGTVAAVDAQTMRIVSRARVGFGAVGLDISPDGRALWVVTQPTRTVRVLRIETTVAPASSVDPQRGTAAQGAHDGAQLVGQRRCNTYGGPGARMGERERAGVQEEPSQAKALAEEPVVLPPPISNVSDQRVRDVLEVPSDLMQPARSRHRFDE